ncbi:MAG: phosphoserine transaminase [Rhodospirillales bacterium]|nr:phosphoserine transaminase [Rhodospirillales bacterium]USO06837.1 MAG: phosphoserine transaminase [Rhodospirillales bacterium]
MTTKPTAKPQVPMFSSGPCAKRPGWSVAALASALVARSHRAAPGKKKLQAVIDGHRRLLGIPADYVVGIVPASDTGAVEMALWSMLGERGVDVLAWESFGTEWLKDITGQLKLPDVREFTADYGFLPDLGQVDCDRDVVFTWNGTTSGVRVPDGAWIKAERKGLTICDATSAVFAYDLPWEKLDVVTWSWQKVLGGEAAHGMLVLSPRAVARLEGYKPPRPLPKIFRMTKKDKDGNVKLNAEIFEGATINTPSMLCVEDCLDALAWAEKAGGLKGLMVRCQANFATVERWVAASEWVAFLPEAPTTRSITSICLKVKDPWFTALPQAAQDALLKSLVKTLDEENVGKDIGSYRDAPGGIRIWGGATVEATDIAALLPWLDWAYASLKAQAA